MSDMEEETPSMSPHDDVPTSPTLSPSNLGSEEEKSRRNNNRQARKTKSTTADQSITLSLNNTKYRVISEAAHKMGWKTREITDSSQQSQCDILWFDSGGGIEGVIRKAAPFQRINHFLGMVRIYRKNFLARSMMRMQKISERSYDFFPRTWVLPMDYNDLMRHMKSSTNSAVSSSAYIVKPSAGAQGKGIYLTFSPGTIGSKEDVVVQTYISRPLLLDNFKFDLRIYALVTCVDPLRVLVYREGLVRLCTTPYSPPDPENCSCAFMHLSNYSINKNSPNFQQSDHESEEDHSSKRSLSWLWRWLHKDRGYTPDRVFHIWKEINDVVVKTLISIQAVLARNYKACAAGSHSSGVEKSPFTCFEILGFDILLTENLKPILLEVNHSPSFRTDSELDAKVKMGLMENVFRLLNIHVGDRKRYITKSSMASQIRLYGTTLRETSISSTEMKYDSIPNQWKRYLENEKKYIGNFDLAYPTDVYADQPTSGRQGLYDSLLSQAENQFNNVSISSYGPSAALHSYDRQHHTSSNDPTRDSFEAHSPQQQQQQQQQQHQQRQQQQQQHSPRSSSSRVSPQGRQSSSSKRTSLNSFDLPDDNLSLSTTITTTTTTATTDILQAQPNDIKYSSVTTLSPSTSLSTIELQKSVEPQIPSSLSPPRLHLSYPDKQRFEHKSPSHQVRVSKSNDRDIRQSIGSPDREHTKLPPPVLSGSETPMPLTSLPPPPSKSQDKIIMEDVKPETDTEIENMQSKRFNIPQMSSKSDATRRSLKSQTFTSSHSDDNNYGFIPDPTTTLSREAFKEELPSPASPIKGERSNESTEYTPSNTYTFDRKNVMSSLEPHLQPSLTAPEEEAESSSPTISQQQQQQQQQEEEEEEEVAEEQQDTIFTLEQFRRHTINTDIQELRKKFMALKQEYISFYDQHIANSEESSN